jgi:8-amino-7-oxononanoate synthase
VPADPDLAGTAGTATDPLNWLARKARRRAAAGLHRTLQPRRADSPLLDLASNDYLDLARDPRVVDAAISAARQWGTGSTGSRLVTGTTALHEELEFELAVLTGAPAALAFSSGYLANLGAVTALSGPGCVVIADSGNHASLIDGCRLSSSRSVVVAHGDLDAAAAALAARDEPRALVVIDAINSADGDLLPLRDWHAMARAHGAVLLVDDAHGVGVRGDGRGSVFEAGLSGEPDVVTTMTLSKSLGSQGGAVLGAPALIEHLIDTARPFIFDTGLAPPAVGAALAATRIVRSEPDLTRAVRARAAQLAEAAGVPATDAAIVPIIIGGASDALAAAGSLRELGIHAGCFRPPSVPVGTARLRLTARAGLTGDDIARLGDALAHVRPRTTTT